MKKVFIFNAFAIFILILLSGCDTDTTPPVITLIGPDTITLSSGDSFTDPGATAEDDIDGDITDRIIVGGDPVDTNTPDTYVITYNVSDSAGNFAEEVRRTVIVQDPCQVCLDTADACHANCNAGYDACQLNCELLYPNDPEMQENCTYECVDMWIDGCNIMCSSDYSACLDNAGC